MLWVVKSCPDWGDHKSHKTGTEQPSEGNSSQIIFLTCSKDCSSDCILLFAMLANIFLFFCSTNLVLSIWWSDVSCAIHTLQSVWSRNCIFFRDNTFPDKKSCWVTCLKVCCGKTYNLTDFLFRFPNLIMLKFIW